VSRVYDKLTAVCDGASQATPLGLSGANAVNSTSLFQYSDVDEMSFDFLKTVSAYYQSFPWTTSNAEDTSLYTINVYPANFYQSSTLTHGAHVLSYNQGPPVYFLTNYFSKWRGSVVIKFKIISNDFYTGRLLITYTPRAGGTVPTAVSSILAIREIIDIRTGNEFELVLPYYLASQYTNNTTSMGVLNVRVLNTLRCPETCNGTVNILTFVRGGEDYEVACPGNYFNNTYMPISLEGRELADAPVGDVQRPSERITEALFCIGEKFTSIKQLLNRYSLIRYMNTGTFPSAPTAINPFYPGLSWTDATTGFNPAYMSTDWYAIFANMYAFSRGSIRIMNTNTSSTQTGCQEFIIDPSGQRNYANNNPWVTAGLNPFTTVSSAPTIASNNYVWNGVGWAVFDAAISNPSISVPFYSSTPVRPNAMQTATRGSFTSTGLDQPWILQNVNPTANMSYRRSCGDDFQFSMFLGAPPVAVSLT